MLQVCYCTTIIQITPAVGSVSLTKHRPRNGGCYETITLKLIYIWLKLLTVELFSRRGCLHLQPIPIDGQHSLKYRDSQISRIVLMATNSSTYPITPQFIKPWGLFPTALSPFHWDGLNPHPATLTSPRPRIVQTASLCRLRGNPRKLGDYRSLTSYLLVACFLHFRCYNIRTYSSSTKSISLILFSTT